MHATSAIIARPNGSSSSLVRRALGSPWGGFLLRKLGNVLLAFCFLVVITFLIVQLIPGDAARAIAGNDASIEQVESMREQLGLTAPLWEQFLRYVGNVFSGTLGESYRVGTVGQQIALRAPYTMIVAGLSILITLILALILGVAVAVLTRDGRRRWLDIIFSWSTAVIDAIPVYVRATLLIILLALQLQIFPAGGAQDARSFVLPILALSIGPVCSLSRVVRREAESVLEADFIRTTHGWRLPQSLVNVKYVLPNVLTSALTMSGLMLSGMIGGALVMEKVFSWPGLGTSVVDAIIGRDYPVVQGTILVLGMLAVLINTVVDIVLGLIDPRNLLTRSES